MKRAFAVIAGLGLALSTASVAMAAQGCGPGGHRGPYGHCRPNGVGPVVGPGFIVGNFYPGRGYWDGGRWRARHERWHGGWRYRD